MLEFEQRLANVLSCSDQPGMAQDLKRLKKHYEQYEPTLTELRHKYEVAMKDSRQPQHQCASAHLQFCLKACCPESSQYLTAGENAHAPRERPLCCEGSGAASIVRHASRSDRRETRNGPGDNAKCEMSAFTAKTDEDDPEAKTSLILLCG